MKKNKANKKIAKTFLKYILHFAAFGVIGFTFFPITKFYWRTFPTIGADFFLAPAYVSYYQKFLSFPMMAWKYIWFSGIPTLIDYPWFTFYMALPLTNFWGASQASQVYLAFTLFLYFIFAYLLFWQLSKSHFLSLALTLPLILSENIYHALFRGGSTPYSASQMFVPLALFFLVKYLQEKNKKYFYLSILTTGVAFIGHPAIPQIFLIIPGLILIFFWIGEKMKISQWKKIRDYFIYLIISIVIGLVTLYPIIYSLFTVETETNFTLSNRVIRPEAIVGMITTTNYVVIVAFFGLLLSIFIFRRFKKIIYSLPFLLIVYYMIIFEWLMETGYNPFASAIGSMRTFWFFPLILGCLCAIFWYNLSEVRDFKLLRKSFKEIFIILIKVGVIIILISPLFKIDKFINYLEETAQGSALIPYQMNEAVIYDKKELADASLPSWMDAQNQNFRFYVTQPSIIFWFNIFYRMPLVGGYYNPLLEEERNWLYWLDVSISRESIEHFNTPEEVAERDVLFLTDWYGIRYLTQPLSSYGDAEYFFDNDEYIQNKETSEDKVNVFEVNSDITSPVIKASNAPRLLTVGNSVAYNKLIRALAKENLNSQYLIPVKGPERIDDIVKEDLSQFEAILLFDYHYKREKNFKSMPLKPWEVLANYVKEGGYLILETGSEVKESDIKDIPGISEYPEIFPIKRNTRGDLGMSWEEEINNQSSLLKDISFKNFSPLIYQNTPWKVSYTRTSDIRSWAKPVISQKGYPVLVEGQFGKGKVVWSGMNLLNHIQSYNNLEESKLFKNILSYSLSLEKESEVNYTSERPRPEKIKVKGNNFKGVLFKENDYGGWQAKIGNQKLKIYRAGLNFMYVMIPPDLVVDPEIQIYYRGTFEGWFFFILSGFTIFLIIIYLLIGQRILKLIPSFGLDKKIKSWWSREDEE